MTCRRALDFPPGQAAVSPARRPTREGTAGIVAATARQSIGGPGGRARVCAGPGRHRPGRGCSADAAGSGGRRTGAFVPHGAAGPCLIRRPDTLLRRHAGWSCSPASARSGVPAIPARRRRRAGSTTARPFRRAFCRKESSRQSRRTGTWE